MTRVLELQASLVRLLQRIVYFAASHTGRIAGLLLFAARIIAVDQVAWVSDYIQSIQSGIRFPQRYHVERSSLSNW
ncbi:hypothetical protein DPMN_050629 [Dreissena polymorpha]|uniref:Uncharacterized protein n=1 Tax=Dreissena polymorpha TaxID=45954 RepID=A0A9D4CH43_DREPO|nr:hypothetical protein DPMN_050629 [Dreissena polymorpha]